jgi:hypothetical protein
LRKLDCLLLWLRFADDLQLASDMLFGERNLFFCENERSESVSILLPDISFHGGKLDAMRDTSYPRRLLFPSRDLLVAFGQFEQEEPHAGV